VANATINQQFEKAAGNKPVFRILINLDQLACPVLRIGFFRSDLQCFEFLDVHPWLGRECVCSQNQESLAPVVSPDTSLKDAGRLMTENRKAPLVVDEGSGELVRIFGFKETRSRATAKELSLSSTPIIVQSLFHRRILSSMMARGV